MSYETKIIKLTLKDLERCIALDIIALNGIWNKQQWGKELINPNSICIGIIKDYELIGLCCGWIISDQINITVLAIHPSAQRKGFGEKLLSYFISLAKHNQVKVITLETKDRNYVAQALFKKLKFIQVATRQKLYKDGSNAIVFQLKFDVES